MERERRITEEDIVNQPEAAQQNPLDMKFASPTEWATHFAEELDRWMMLEAQHYHFKPFSMTVALVCAILEKAIHREHVQ